MLVNAKQPILDKKALEKKIKAQEERDRQIVRGKFVFNECPGASLKFSVRKYKGDIDTYELLDGFMYDLPLWVADHLNENVFYPMYGHNPLEKEMYGAIDPKGTQPFRIVSKKCRVNFYAIDFKLTNSAARDLVVVEKV